MATVVLYNKEGKNVGNLDLEDSIFQVELNPALVHEAVVAQTANSRMVLAHTKGRGEVRGADKKPWKQKGTGRARHGSRRSPIWSGGGVSHGPISEKNYDKKINKKVRAKALATTLSKKFADGEMIFVQDLNFDAPKASDAKAIIKAVALGSGNDALANKRKNAALVVFSGRNENAELSFRNFGNYEVAQAKDINPVDLLTYKYVIVAEPTESLDILLTRVAKVTPKAA